MTRLIDADEMVKSLMDMTFYDEEGHIIDDYEDRLAIVKSFVDSVPTVEAQPVRHGTWIEGKAKNIKTGEVRLVRKCSECESGYFIYDFLNSVDEIPRFCPNCGANMGEDDGTD